MVLRNLNFERFHYFSSSGDHQNEKSETLDTKQEDTVVEREAEPHVTVVQDHEPIPRLYRESTFKQASNFDKD